MSEGNPAKPVDTVVDRADLKALAESAFKEFQDADKPAPRGFMWQHEIDGVRFDPWVITHLLGTAISQYSRMSLESPDFEFYFFPTPHGFSSKETARGFVLHFYDEIKDIVCNPRRQTEAARLSRYKLGPTCAALSAFVMQRFGLNEPVAVGVGAYLLIVLLESTKGAFCKMSKKEVQDCVEKS